MSKKKKPPPDVGLRRRYARKPVREFLDMDYVDSLSEAEKIWLNKFALEYYQAAFGKDPIHPKDKRKSCYDANNARNRDMWHKSDRLPEIRDDADDETKEQGTDGTDK